MGTVHLTRGHHGLFCRRSDPDLEERMELTGDMLDLPIYRQEGSLETIRDTRASMFRAMMRGLLALKGFGATVSFDYGEKDDLYFMFSYRTWGEIYLEQPNDLVVTFTHDSRENNSPFVGLYQWLEEFSDKDMDDEAFYAFESEWSDPEKWHQFFIGRIRRKIDEVNKASELSNVESVAYAQRALKIEEALG